MYLDLFKTIANSAEQISERVYDADLKIEDNSSARAASVMREDYRNLGDKLAYSGLDNLDRKDYAKLLVGVYIIVNQLESKIQAEQKVIDMYKADLIPKLDQIINEKNDNTLYELAQKFFQNSET